MDGAITIDATAFMAVTGALAFAGVGMVAAIGALWRRAGKLDTALHECLEGASQR